MHKLSIIEDDFTFVQVYGSRNQAFGSAGDCYSRTIGQCPKGRFSINFEQTKFRIRRTTQWEATNNSTLIFDKKVKISENKKKN